MRHALPIFAALVALAAPACAGVADDGATGSEDLTAADSALIRFSAASRHSLFVRLPAKPSKELTDAMVAAANRGVDTHAVLLATEDFDANWTMQQHLESSGVDVDVRKDGPLDDVLAFSDDTALVPGTTGTKTMTGADAAKIGKRFTNLLDANPARTGNLAPKNTIRILPMPDSSRDRIVAIFGAAKRSIDLEIYQLQDRAVVRALLAAVARKVAVRVMLEPKTVGAANFDAVSKELSAAGATVQATPPDFDAHRNVDHAKFAVIDDAELLFGSGNLVRSGLGGVTEGIYDNRDFWVEDTREASVQAGRALFAADFARKATRPADFDGFVLTPDNANAKILDLIDKAQKRLFVYNQSLNDTAIIDKLLAAKQRGVDVRVLLGFQPGMGGPPPNQATVAQLKKGGVDAALLRKHYLHGKAIVSDDRAYIGSQNFTSGGLRNNRELGEIFDDQALVRTLASTFEDDARP